MGRRIDLSRPLSDEDKAYLRSRARGYQVDLNEKLFAHLGEDGRQALREEMEAGDAEEERANAELIAQLEEEGEFDEDLILQVSRYDVNLLRQKLKDLGEEDSLQPGQSKRELQELLLNRLQDDRDATQ